MKQVVSQEPPTVTDHETKTVSTEAIKKDEPKKNKPQKKGKNEVHIFCLVCYPMVDTYSTICLL